MVVECPDTLLSYRVNACPTHNNAVGRVTIARWRRVRSWWFCWGEGGLGFLLFYVLFWRRGGGGLELAGFGDFNCLCVGFFVL